MVEWLNRISVLLPIKTEQSHFHGDNIGFDYKYMLAVIGLVANRHEKAEVWRQKNKLLYGEP